MLLSNGEGHGAPSPPNLGDVRCKLPFISVDCVHFFFGVSPVWEKKLEHATGTQPTPKKKYTIYAPFFCDLHKKEGGCDLQPPPPLNNDKTSACHLRFFFRDIPKDELSTGQATGQMANKRGYAFIFQKMPFLGE